ncbi:hypothetical protein D3C72_907070 [compost metagenome]
MLSVAWFRLTPGRRLKLKVTAGIWPRWLTVTGPTPSVTWVTEARGTRAPEAERT